MPSMMLSTQTRQANPRQPAQPTALIAAGQDWVQQSGIRHVAIIMDGNRRWARKHLLPAVAGHAKGVDALKTMLRHCSDVGLEALTVFAFSTENWRREATEVDAIMGLFIKALSQEIHQLHDEGVVLRFIGGLDALPHDLQTLMHDSMALTAQNHGDSLSGGRQLWRARRIGPGHPNHCPASQSRDCSTPTPLTRRQGVPGPHHRGLARPRHADSHRGRVAH
jgi:hypothetical protein